MPARHGQASLSDNEILYSNYMCDDSNVNNEICGTFGVLVMRFGLMLLLSLVRKILNFAFQVGK